MDKENVIWKKKKGKCNVYKDVIDTEVILVIVNNGAVNVGCKCVFKSVILFPWDIHPEVELLNHMVVLFLLF